LEVVLNDGSFPFPVLFLSQPPVTQAVGLLKTKDRKTLMMSESTEQINSDTRVVGWNMNPEDVKSFIKRLGKKVITFVGYSSPYEREEEMLKVVETVLPEYSPKTHIVNIGATIGGIGAAYSVAKSMGFTTIGIVSSLAKEYMESISAEVDHVCFVEDESWGGINEETKELNPTSKVIVESSDIMIGIGGNDVGRDELLAGKKRGKEVRFYPAEMNHEFWIGRMKNKGLPPPESFWGTAHEAFVNEE
jgi:hypothetical protein